MREGQNANLHHRREWLYWRRGCISPYRGRPYGSRLVRSKAKADAVAAYGVEAVVGSLDDAALLQAEAQAADAVVNAASSDHRGAVEALIAGLSGSGKPLIHSSGSSIVADLAMGEPSDRIFHEATPIEPHADKAARVAIDRLV